MALNHGVQVLRNEKWDIKIQQKALNVNRIQAKWQYLDECIVLILNTEQILVILGNWMFREMELIPV